MRRMWGGNGRYWPQTYPADPFHVVLQHILLLRSHYHTRSNDAHVRHDLRCGELVFVDEISCNSCQLAHLLYGVAATSPPIKTPVLPRPALQCTATLWPLSSMTSRQIWMNRLTMSSDGLDPSSKYISTWSIPASMNVRRSYLRFTSNSRPPQALGQWRGEGRRGRGRGEGRLTVPRSNESPRPHSPP